MRKSNALHGAGNRQLALTTSNRAVHLARREAPHLLPVCLRQQALSGAYVGDERAAREALELALSLSAPAINPADSLAPYCTTSYVQMEAALCWLALRMPSAAVEACSAALDAWPDKLVRDRVLCMTRLAVALAELREAQEASAIGIAAAELLRVARSARAIHMLRPQRDFDGWPRV